MCEAVVASRRCFISLAVSFDVSHFRDCINARGVLYIGIVTLDIRP